MRKNLPTKAGWWLMELLLAITIIGALMSAGVMAFVQSASWADDVMARNMAWQTDLVRLVLAMQRDARQSSRIVATEGRHVTYSGNPLSANTHGKSVLVGGIEQWDLDWPVNLESAQTRAILDATYVATTSQPTDSQDFFGGWAAADANVGFATIAGGYSSTILFLRGPSTINAAVYFKVTPDTVNKTITYTIERYENNGGRLVAAENFSYTASGYDTTDDQMNSASSAAIKVRPEYYDFAVGKISASPGNAYAIRFPSALSKGLYRFSDGKQASRVKKVAEFNLYLQPGGAATNAHDTAAWLDYWKGQNGL